MNCDKKDDNPLSTLKPDRLLDDRKRLDRREQASALCRLGWQIGPRHSGRRVQALLLQCRQARVTDAGNRITDSPKWES